FLSESSLKSSINVVNKSIPSRRERYIFMLEIGFQEDEEVDDFINYLNKQFSIYNIKYKLRGWTQINEQIKIETYTNVEENLEIIKIVKNYSKTKLITIYKQAEEAIY